jgi:hypothetical protein
MVDAMRNLRDRLTVAFLVGLAAAAAPAPGRAQTAPGIQPLDGTFTRDFRIQDCDLVSHGTNPYFILEPGYRQVYEGDEDGEHVLLVITVLDRTIRIGDVEARVVVERETHDGELAEVSKNYFAICQQTNSVFYFGEDVDNYDDGVLVNHHGSWRAGTNNARPGLIMSGTILLGGKYFQELAPGTALDRAEIVSLDATVGTPFGPFVHALKIRETTLLEPGSVEFKYYAAGVGLIKDETLTLVQAGFTGP